MMRIAIVEDEDSAAERLLTYIHRYEEEKNVNFDTVCFTVSFRIFRWA